MKKVNLFDLNENDICPCCNRQLHVRFDDGDIFDAQCICGVSIYMTMDGNYDSFQADPDPKYFMVNHPAESSTIIRLVPNFMSLEEAMHQYLSDVAKEHRKHVDSDAELQAYLNKATLTLGNTENGMKAIHVAYEAAFGQESLNLAYVGQNTMFTSHCHHEFMEYRQKYLDCKSQGKNVQFRYEHGIVDEEYSLPAHISQYSIVTLPMQVIAFHSVR
ncbi:hypothetical protein [Vibrio harveyi]|uniref:hypothetical protein n=1 Tax=Vibrio harveyi TaxID=669 RepID=UPI003CE84763